MAQSRLEKVGTIYSRISSLVKAGSIKEENKPFWLEIYKNFPPKYEPHYDRKIPDITIRQIFYPEDALRAKFYKDYKNHTQINMIDHRAGSKTKHFIDIYRKIKKEGISEEQLYDKAVEEFLIKLKNERPQKETEDAEFSVPKRKFIKIKKTGKDSNVEETKKLTEKPDKKEIKYSTIKLRLDKIMSMSEEDNTNKSS